MLEPDGNIITAERLDITDDFRDGFICSLNVVTIDQRASPRRPRSGATAT